MNPLMEPGAIRALRAYSVDAFDVFARRLLSNVGIKASGEDRPSHVRLLAHVLREVDHDPRLLKITAERPSKRGLNYSEHQKKLNFPTPWQVLESALEVRPLEARDWWSMSQTMANALLDQERECGIALVHAALDRPDLCCDAIDRFKKIFVSARDEHGGTALTKVAHGAGLHASFTVENSGHPGFSGRYVAEVVGSLKRAKVRLGEEVLVSASLSASPAIRHAFMSAYGAQACLQASDKEGYGALHRAMLKPNNDVDIERLLADGFDPQKEDKNHRTPLECAARVPSGLAGNVATLLRHRRHLRQTIEKLFVDVWVKDEQVRALLSSERARMSIDDLLTGPSVDAELLKSDRSSGSTPETAADVPSAQRVHP